MDNSAARSAVRANKRFPTFVQAINRINPTDASSTSEAIFVGPASWSLSSVMREGDWIFWRGVRSGQSRSASAANAWRAWGHIIPGFNRATTSQPLLPRLNAPGFQRTVLPG
jgi:hypothetical protein